MTTVTKAQDELAKLLRHDAELHAKIAKAASGMMREVTRDSAVAALGVDASKDTA